MSGLHLVFSFLVHCLIIVLLIYCVPCLVDRNIVIVNDFFFPPLQLERSFKFMREAEDQLKVIPQFCFPDAKDWAPVDTFPRSVPARLPSY